MIAILFASDPTPLLLGIGAVLSPLVTIAGLFVLVRGQNATRAQVEQGQWDSAVAVSVVDDKLTNVAAEVATTNGIPGGQLLERQEAYRIQQIPPKKRTTSEQEYVDKLEAAGRDLGHNGPLDRTMGPEGGNPKTQAERDAL